MSSDRIFVTMDAVSSDQKTQLRLLQNPEAIAHILQLLQTEPTHVFYYFPFAGAPTHGSCKELLRLDTMFFISNIEKENGRRRTEEVPISKRSSIRCHAQQKVIFVWSIPIYFQEIPTLTQIILK